MDISRELFEKAIVFATKAHEGQFRKGSGLPYIVHPLQAMLTLFEIKKTNYPYLLGTVLLLHDVVEDTDVTIETIALEFGHNVASIVYELTSDEDEKQRIGKSQYLNNKITKMSSFAKRCKLIDRLVNIRDSKLMDKPFRIKTVFETKSLIEAARGTYLTKTHKKIIRLIEKELSLLSA